MLEPSPHAWWAVALSEELNRGAPVAVDIGALPVALWRDAAGVARALEDRCPHAGVRLSGGRVAANGWLRCGAHGWRFDGATGRLSDLPGMKAGQLVPAAYHARAFSVTEGGGFVRVAIAPEAQPPAVGEALALHGASYVALGHARYAAALLDDPALLIGMRQVRWDAEPDREPAVESGRIVVARRCRWRGWPGRGGLTLVTGTEPVTGETGLMLRDAGQVLLAAVIAPVPAARGVTAVRWRARLGPAAGPMALALRLPGALRVFQTIDAARLRVRPAGASALLILGRDGDPQAVQGVGEAELAGKS